MPNPKKKTKRISRYKLWGTPTVQCATSDYQYSRGDHDRVTLTLGGQAKRFSAAMELFKSTIPTERNDEA